MRKKLFVFLIILAISFIPGIARGETEESNEDNSERIIFFYSDITVQPDSSMTVEEIIEVHAANYEIVHGIYRDFPTRYKDRFGNPVTVDFRVNKVYKNGRDEPFSVKNISNGKRIYIGSKDITLQPGNYEYRIFYQTSRQLGFFKDHDELYWNVTGNGWIFPMEQAGARVRLPKNVPQDQIVLEGYTGSFGFTEKNFTASFEDGLPSFKTTQGLGPREGLTIVVSWPKGYVQPPSPIKQVGYFIKDNWAMLLALLGLIGLFIFYLYYWVKVGKDPKPETIIPLYAPPGGLSPGAIRYIRMMGSDNTAFTAAIINMAVKGVITIQEKDKKYTLIKNKEPEGILSPEEIQICKYLFKSHAEILVDDANYTKFGNAQEHFDTALERNYQKPNFSRNRKYFGYGILITLIAMLPWIIYMGVFGFNLLSLGVFALYVTVNIIFFRLLKAYTIQGRKLLDQIEGFKLYLTVAEKDRMNMVNPPNETPELFEKYLPYALALEVGHIWAQRFAGILAHAGEGGQPYVPGWYTGPFLYGGFHPTHFTQSLGSTFSSAISSAGVPPGSSSGSSFGGGGGGGFSGGGGGGGGGGGW